MWQVRILHRPSMGPTIFYLSPLSEETIGPSLIVVDMKFIYIYIYMPKLPIQET